MANTGIIGAGSWGCALAAVLERNGHPVTVWSIVEAEVAMLQKEHEHKDKLPGVTLGERVSFTSDLKEAVEGKELLVLAVPSVYTRGTARQMASFIKKGQIIVCVAKGIEESSLMTKQTAEYIQGMFMNEVFRVYTSPDVLGMELGGALKNVIALAAGMADGLGFGDNTKAALITRGMAEIRRLAVKMGAGAETMNGLTGIGDLIVTCASRHSRNRKAGMLMGQGYTMQQAMDEVKMVVEGVYSAKAAIALSKKYGVSMPIIEQVNQVLFEDKPVREAVTELMLRDKKAEYAALEWGQENGNDPD